MEKKVLKLLTENARIGIDELASRCDISEEEAAKIVKFLEESGTIRGYTAILNGKGLGESFVKALIEVKVAPFNRGSFDTVAKRISRYPEVTDVMLVSGSFDILVTVESSSISKLADFVAEKLATADGVVSTSTGFFLKKYKESGKIMYNEEDYERLNFSF